MPSNFITVSRTGAFTVMLLDSLFLEIELIKEPCIQLVDRDADLLHAVAHTDGDSLILCGLEIVGQAERCADLVLSAIALADIAAVVKLAVVAPAELLVDLKSVFGKLLGEGKDTDLDGCQRGMEAHNGTLVAALELLFVVSCAQECQGDTVCAQGRLDNVRDVAGLLLVVKVGQILTGGVLVLGQVIVCPVRDAPQLAPAEGEQELDVRGSLGIEGKLLGIMVAHAGLFGLEAEGHQPVPAEILPIFEPLEVCIGLAEKLKLHLLELTGTEGEVTGCDLISERLTHLADAEGNLLPGSSLDILEVYENTLCGLGAKIYCRRGVLGNTLEGLEHQVELTDIGPVELAAGRAGNSELVDEAHHFICCPAVNAAVQSHLLLGRIALDQLIRTITGTAGLAVHERVGKACQMSAGDPGAGIHEDCAVDADVLGRLSDKFLPPCLLDVVLELNAQIAVIPCIGQTAVDLGTGIDESSVVAKRNDLFHCLFHNSL